MSSAVKDNPKEQEAFWESIKKSADLIRNEPNWIKAGVAIAEDGFTTLGSSLKPAGKSEKAAPGK